jgi:hypothetical protein
VRLVVKEQKGPNGLCQTALHIFASKEKRDRALLDPGITPRYITIPAGLGHVLNSDQAASSLQYLKEEDAVGSASVNTVANMIDVERRPSQVPCRFQSIERQDD